MMSFVSCCIYWIYLSVDTFRLSYEYYCCCVALAEVLRMVQFFSRCKSTSHKLLFFFGRLFQLSRNPFATLLLCSMVKDYPHNKT